MGNVFQNQRSMAEQGGFYQVDVVDTQAITIPNGVTNIMIVGSGTPEVTRFITHEEVGRKLRFFARNDSTATQFTDGNNIVTTGTDTTIGALDSVEFVCIPYADGTKKFVETNLSNIS